MLSMFNKLLKNLIFQVNKKYMSFYYKKNNNNKLIRQYRQA